jgi:hypothetical protein
MAKNTLSTTPIWIKILIPLIVLFAGAFVTWGRRDERIENICKDEIPALKETDKQLYIEIDANCEKFERKFEQQETAIRTQNEAVIKLQSDVGYIKEGIDDIKRELRSQ